MYVFVTNNFICIRLQNSVTMFNSLFIHPLRVLYGNNKLYAKNGVVSVNVRILLLTWGCVGLSLRRGCIMINYNLVSSLVWNRLDLIILVLTQSLKYIDLISDSTLTPNPIFRNLVYRSSLHTLSYAFSMNARDIVLCFLFDAFKATGIMNTKSTVGRFFKIILFHILYTFYYALPLSIHLKLH